MLWIVLLAQLIVLKSVLECMICCWTGNFCLLSIDRTMIPLPLIAFAVHACKSIISLHPLEPCIMQMTIESTNRINRKHSSQSYKKKTREKYKSKRNNTFRMDESPFLDFLVTTLKENLFRLKSTLKMI